MFKQLRLLIVFSFLMTVLVQSTEPGRTAFALPDTPPSIDSPQQPASASWYDGMIQYSTITNCFSIIQGLPYQENGVGTYVGFMANPNGGQPTPNQSYYIHVVIAGLGNSCSGQRAYIDLALPANSSLAINSTDKVRCYYDGGALAAADCPQILPQSTYNPGAYVIPSSDSAHLNLWPIPQGHILEIQVPIKTSTALTNSQMQANVWMFDGNSSPWLRPQQGVFVFSNTYTPPSINYPAQSTVITSTTDLKSFANLFAYQTGGSYSFDLGTDTSYSLWSDPGSIPAGYTWWIIWEDWRNASSVLMVNPDTLYHWRLTYTPTVGAKIYGADQTFRTLPDGHVTVGNGASASCTPAAFTTALSTAKELRFECGPQPITITLSSAQSITSNVTIIGGNKVTLDMANSNRHFTIQAGNTLTLTQIALINGNAPLVGCGGAVYVPVNARLVLNETRFIGNHSGYQGGALCINGAASITTTLFMSNTAGSHGGAIGNYGTTSIGNSRFTGNTAGINGGAIDTTVNLIVDTATFISNTAIYRGGGINNYLGVMSINNSTFTGNSANGYGGGASNDAGNAAINGSTFNANFSYNGGGLQNSGTLNLINTTLSANRALASGANITATGGGLYWVGGSIAVLNTTLVSNTAAMAGGNLYAGGGLANTAITLKNTLIAFGSPDNCDTSIVSQSHNLESADSCGLIGNGDKINLNPRVGPLQNNGGPSWTHALDLNSPARDAATNIGCPLTDQRGVIRPQGATCDIGAYEGTPVRWVYLPLIRR